MAQVVFDTDPGRFVDHDLDRLLRFWRTVPEQADEWPEWDEYSRVDFAIEWPIERERLTRVTQAAQAGILDERQQRDWHELQQLIATHRATVESMLKGPI